MGFRRFGWAFVALMGINVVLVPIAVAQDQVQTDPLSQIVKLSSVLRMPEVAAVMRDEGLAYGTTLQEEMFPGQGGSDWDAAVAGIYDTKVMLDRFQTRLTEELQTTPDAVSEALVFFDSPAGQRILALELEARRALTDEAAEEAAKIAVEDMIASADPRMDVLRQFAETNELIDLNTAGAMNANLAFYQGLSDGGAFGGDMTEDQMLADVWAQEADVRAQTEEWMFSFLALAYAPLSEADMTAYQTFSETEGARRVNLALFSAFDSMFTPISRDLGRAAARQMQGEDI